MVQALTRPGLERLHAAMAARVEKHELPGLVMLIARGDQVEVDTIGTTSFDTREPMQRDSLFRIASMTKPVLAAATMMLVEEGKLAVDDAVDRWLPELANRRVLRQLDGPLDETVPARRPITVDDLLTMRMGYGTIFDPSIEPPYPIVNAANELQLAVSYPDPPTPHAPDEWIRRFGTLPLMSQPGERWQYNTASLVLGVLVARVAGRPLGDFFQTRLFEPLGMRRTGFWLPLEITRSLPDHYMTDFQTGLLERRPVSTAEQWSRPPAFPSGAGGLVSTADDFLAFAQMLLNDGVFAGKRLLSEESVQRMTTNHLTPEQIATAGPVLAGRGWGYGMAVVTQPDDAWPVPGRYGWSGGYGTVWFSDPQRQIVAIALSQVSDVLWNGTLNEFDQLVAAV